jgi:CelD/BcsL family acetyltransferase involved in cellulose biosynthesis
MPAAAQSFPDAPARDAVDIEIANAARFAALGAAWAGLVGRAALPNVAMHPAVAEAAVAAGADVRVLLAWRGDNARSSRRLVGAWVMAQGALLRRWPVRALLSPCDRNLILGTPVVDRDGMADILGALLAAAARDRALPPVLHIREFAGDEALRRALRDALAARGARAIVLGRMVRPALETGPDVEAYIHAALSRKRRAELRRCRRRLADRGVVEVTTHTGAQSAITAFEAFLALEARGWKGREGGALARRGAPTTRFVTAMVRGLARDGAVSVMVLRLDGRPVAIEVVLRSGGVAHTWKSTYDEEFSSVAPGFVLLETLTRSFLADPTLRFVDMSNNAPLDDARSVAAFWRERHEVTDLLIELRRVGFAGFRLTALALRLRRLYGAIARRARNRPRPQLSQVSRRAALGGANGAPKHRLAAAGALGSGSEEE